MTYLLDSFFFMKSSIESNLFNTLSFRARITDKRPIKHVTEKLTMAM